MSKIYRLLLCITTIIIFYNISSVNKDVTSLSIPDADVAVVVENMGDRYSTQEIFQTLQSYAEENNVRFHKVAFGTDDQGKEVKKIYTFQPARFSSYQYKVRRGDEVAFLNVKDLEYSSPKGTYYFSRSLPSDFLKTLVNLGLEVTVEPVGVFSILQQALFSMLGFSSFVLFLLCFLACFFYYCSLSKKVGLFHLLGKSYWRQVIKAILLELAFVALVGGVAGFNGLSWKYTFVLLAGFSLILALFHIISFLTTSSFVTVVEKLKGRRPYQQLLKVAIVFKFILVICFAWLIQQSVHQVTTIGQLRDSLSIWKRTEDVYRLSFSGETTLLPDVDSSPQEIKERQERVDQIVRELILLGEKSRSILAISNDNRLTTSTSYLVSHPFLVVNPHYLTAVSILDQESQPITRVSEDSFTLLIPEEQMEHKDQIEQEVREWIDFNQNVTSEKLQAYTGPVQMKSIKGHQKLFHLDVDQKKPYSHSPVVLVFPLSLWGESLDTLVAEVSQGHYLFKNPEVISSYLTEHHLQEEFIGLSSSKELGMEKLKEAEKEQSLQLVLLFTLVLTLGLVLYLVLSSYIEMRKKKLFILHILGKGFYDKHGNFLGFIVGGSFASLILLMILIQLSPWIFLGVLVSELVLACLLILRFEKIARLNLLKKGE